MSLEQSEKYSVFFAGYAGAKKVCFEDFSKDMFLEAQMKSAVKYGVY